MQKLSYTLMAFALLLTGAVAQAQTAGTITFTANKTSSTGSFQPVLTWSTTPVATSCTAGGAWSGTKFASGSETLATITSSKSYTLTCSWGNGSAKVNWTIPTTNTDGSKLTDLAGFKVVFGTSRTSLNQSYSVNSATATSATVPALASGTWYLAVRAVNQAGVESAASNIVEKTIASASTSKTINITITPASTTLKVTNSRVYDIRYVDGVRQLGREVGTVPVGTKCNSNYPVPTNYYPVPRDLVKLTRTPRSNTVVARCAKS